MSAAIGMLWLVMRRTLSRWRLLLFVFAGFVAAVTLIASIPIFTDGALNRLLWRDLGSYEGDDPLGTLVVLAEVGTTQTIPFQRYQQADAFMREQAAAMIGWPLLGLTRSGLARVTKMVPIQDVDLPKDQRQYESAGLAFLTGIEDHVEVVRGAGFVEHDGAAVPALVSERFFYDANVAIGDHFIYGLDDPQVVVPVELEIVGVWRAADDDASFWIEQPTFFDFYFVIPERDFLDTVAPSVPHRVFSYAWSLAFDTSRIRMDGVDQGLRGLGLIRARMAAWFSLVSLRMPVQSILETYVQRAAALRMFLVLLSVPGLIILLVYILFTFGILVRFEADEIAILKSRGASGGQVLLMYVMESILLGILAAVVGIGLASGMAQLMGKVYRFLTFAARPPLVLSVPPRVAAYAGAAVALGVGATLWPAVRASQHTVVSHGARAARGDLPAGQGMRIVLEVFCVVVAIYGYWILKREGAEPAGLEVRLLVDPILLLVPAMAAAALSLLVLRLVPLLVEALVRTVDLFPGAAIGLVLRQIARQPWVYHFVLFILMLTNALGLFGASFADTLDGYYSDVTRYKVGSDLVLDVRWELVQASAGVASPMASATGRATQLDTAGEIAGYDSLLLERVEAETERQRMEREERPELARWRRPPFEVVHSIEGVEAATRVLRTQAQVQGTGSRISGPLLGIDRAEYGRASWWRDDMGPEPLGVLMNALAQNPAGILVSRAFSEQAELAQGDELSLLVDGAARPSYFVVVGVVDYFPTLDPSQGPFFVANLDRIYQVAGVQPYEIWAKLSDSAPANGVVEDLRERGFIIVDAVDSRLQIAAWRTDPESTALFGMLSGDFITAIVISSLSFILYTLLSARQRLPHFGLLRALGLSKAQLIVMMLFEYLILALVGAAGGTLVGIATSRMFIPLLRMDLIAQGATLPFVVSSVWGHAIKVYVAFGAMLVITLWILAWRLGRLRVHEALRMGGRP